MRDDLSKVIMLIGILALSFQTRADETSITLELKKKLFSKTTVQERELYILTGSAKNEPFCFVKVVNDKNYVQFSTKVKSDLPHRTSRQHGTFLLMFSSKSGKGKDAKMTSTQTGFEVVQTSNRDGVEIASLRVSLLKGKSGIGQLKTVRQFNSSEDPSAPAIKDLNFKVARQCENLKVVASFNDKKGQRLAEQAAEKWNSENPTKRQTGEVLLISCDGRTPDSILCIADGEGAGDGDEPVLEFVVKRDRKGQVTVTSSKYFY
jgi:hypothetical protein